MSHMLLEILVEEALKENKSSSTFKANSFVKVVRGVHGSVRFRLKKQTEPNYMNFVKY
jgi:hypothetical protein